MAQNGQAKHLKSLSVWIGLETSHVDQSDSSKRTLLTELPGGLPASLAEQEECALVQFGAMVAAL